MEYSVLQCNLGFLCVEGEEYVCLQRGGGERVMFYLSIVVKLHLTKFGEYRMRCFPDFLNLKRKSKQ